MKNLLLPVTKNQSSVISNNNNSNDNGTPSNGLRSNDYQRYCGSCNCNFDVTNSFNCWKHGISKYHKQANIPRKEKTLTKKFFSNVLNRFSSPTATASPSSSSSSSIRHKSPPKKMQLISSSNFSSSSFSNNKNNNINKSSTKKDLSKPTSKTSLSVKMKIKIFRRNISPKPQEVVAAAVDAHDYTTDLNGQPTSSSINVAASKKKSKGRRTSRNPAALCPFSPSVSISGSEDDEPKPEPSNGFLRVARELCLRFTSSHPESSSSSQPPSNAITTRRSTTATTTAAATNDATFLSTFTEILSNPSLGSPSERAEIACNVIHSTIEYSNVLVPDMISITAATYYWGMMDRYEAERLLEGKPEGTFLLRDSAQINYLFSVSFRRYQRTLHARIEHINGIYSFDIHDDAYHRAEKINDLVENYKDPKQCLFYEPQLSLPLKRDFAFDLKHLCRAVITSHTTYENISTLPLPPPLKKYLREYHFKQPIRVTDHDV